MEKKFDITFVILLVSVIGFLTSMVVITVLMSEVLVKTFTGDVEPTAYEMETGAESYLETIKENSLGCYTLALQILKDEELLDNALKYFETLKHDGERVFDWITEARLTSLDDSKEFKESLVLGALTNYRARRYSKNDYAYYFFDSAEIAFIIDGKSFQSCNIFTFYPSSLEGSLF